MFYLSLAGHCVVGISFDESSLLKANLQRQFHFHYIILSLCLSLSLSLSLSFSLSLSLSLSLILSLSLSLGRNVYKTLCCLDMFPLKFYVQVFLLVVGALPIGWLACCSECCDERRGNY